MTTVQEALIALISAHTPSLSDDDERVIDERSMNTMVDRYGQHEFEAADLALRTCHCGTKIDGFYEYVEHLKAMVQ